MSNLKPSLPKGTRDFGPQQMAKRNFIFSIIQSVFQKFGFQPLETPSMENLSVLTGKYGDEGDHLLFKILNTGDYLSKVDATEMGDGSKALLPKIAEKGLRYDLTVPFARYVVMNQHEITFPFKRYQIQPVWRADRPQKGRYREFYQCDADVVGTDSLLCETEIVMMISEVFEKLGITEYTIKINNRKVLTGIAETIGAQGKENALFVAIDKLDKIGTEKVLAELREKGFSEENVEKLVPILNVSGDTVATVVQTASQIIRSSETGKKGIEEVETLIRLLEAASQSQEKVQFDITLARGLSYYTGTIFEVKVNNVEIGSVSGGGRYDNLTGMFGLSGVSGVGISFGVDRIYDVMEELHLFPEEQLNGTQVLIINFDETSMQHALGLVKKLRNAGIKAEIYPDSVKLKKQFSYADKNNIPNVLIAGPEEIAAGNYTLKNMKTGEQHTLTIDEILTQLGSEPLKN